LLALGGWATSESIVTAPFAVYGTVGFGASVINLGRGLFGDNQTEGVQTGAGTIAAQGAMNTAAYFGANISLNTYNNVTLGSQAVDLGVTLVSGNVLGNTAQYVNAYDSLSFLQSPATISLLSSVNTADDFLGSIEGLNTAGTTILSSFPSGTGSGTYNFSPTTISPTTATYDNNAGDNSIPSSIQGPEQQWFQFTPDDLSGFNGAMSDLPVGGVLLNTAATLVGQNLSDITGAMYDPVSGQFMFLGTNNVAPVKNINLDYLYTALQSVYGSAQPPYVTLDSSVVITSQGAQTLSLPTISGSFTSSFYDPYQLVEDGGCLIIFPNDDAFAEISYDPIWPGEDTTVDVELNVIDFGPDADQETTLQWTARFNCVSTNLVFSQWIADTNNTLPPAGVTMSYQPGGIYGNLELANGPDYILINSANAIPARQQRLFGGRVDNSKVGWVMGEADRVLKCLTVGTDDITNATYSSTTTSPNLHAIPGYSNMVERLTGTGNGTPVNMRFWFTPNQMTLQQYIDPNTGLASIVFTNSTVSCNTEAFMEGLPQSPQAKAFADNLTTNYDQFAALKFPCYDPNDPTGKSIIYTNIFGMLRDVMKAVSLARFFRDNNIPVDMWWLNSWQCPTAFISKSVPTAENITGTGGAVCYGGVQDYLPNTYIPSVTASNVAAVVQSTRPDMTGNTNGDIQQQIWTNSTVVGSLRAVAVNANAEPQDGNVHLVERDLSFASPGAMKLSFSRYYQSSWLGNDAFGPGWRYTPFVLEFERPSWFDQTHLMVDATGTNLMTFANGDTGLRSGAVRLVNLRTGATLDFESSLVLGYSVNNLGNPVITVAGLTTNDMPVFTLGLRQSGATLTQLPGSLNYQCVTPDGQSLTFDSNGHLLTATDRYSRVKSYNYDGAAHLLFIADDAGQSLTFGYDPTTNYIMSVTGPANEQVVYTYTTNGCLATATHVRSGAYVSYTYNTNRQLTAKTLFNGLNALQTQPDLKGRASTNHDVRGNSLVRAFTQDRAGQVRTNETHDPLVIGPQFVTKRRQHDRSGRLLASRNVTGAETSYGYNAGSLLPNTVALPIAGRPPIGIQRDTYGRPTRISDPGNTGAYDVTATYDTNTTQLNQVTDEAGRPTSLYYNGNHKLHHVQRTHNGSQTVNVGFNYTGSGALCQITNPLNHLAVTINRDALDRATNVVDATGVAAGCQYDSLGRLWKLNDPRLASPVVYHYDNFDRLTEVDYPGGTNYFAYDPVKGWLVSQTDMLGRVTRYDHDPNTGDILQIVQLVPGGNNLTTVMSYNRFGNLASVTPPQSATITYNYDGIGRQIGGVYSGANIPGAPTGLVCDHATNGLPTTITNLIFSWQPPVSSAGLNGYSYGFDQMPGDVTNTVGTGAAITNVTLGAHLFQVKAQDTNGMWGPTADFQFVAWAPGTEPPGAPPGLVCNVTANGVPTYTATNIIFTWQVPTSENGVAGYSYALNATPANTINTVATTATFASVAAGTSIFQVMAKGSNGVWGATSSFQLTVLQTPGLPNLAITFVGPDSVSISWPNTGSYTLQQNSNLATTNWTTSGYSITTAKGTNSITITPPTENLFFRLSNP